MDVLSLDPVVLRNLLKLTETRLALQKDIEALDAEIAGLFGKPSAAPAKRRGRPPGSKAAPKAAKAPKEPKAKAAKPAKAPRSGGRRGALKERILAVLTQAGEQGIAVKDIANKLGVNAQNVHVWFSSTGKKMDSIEKVATGVYRLTV